MSFPFFFLISALVLTSHADSVFDGARREDPQDYLLCRQCGTDVADLNYLIHKRSPLSLSVKNETLSGHDILVQTLKNPLDVYFDVIILKKSACIGLGRWQSVSTWFPGYSWKPCICKRCGLLLGWVFEPVKKLEEQQQVKVSDEGFYAVLLENVLSEEFSNSLLAVPKLFKS